MRAAAVAAAAAVGLAVVRGEYCEIISGKCDGVLDQKGRNKQWITTESVCETEAEKRGDFVPNGDSPLAMDNRPPGCYYSGSDSTAKWHFNTKDDSPQNCTAEYKCLCSCEMSYKCDTTDGTCQEFPAGTDGAVASYAQCTASCERVVPPDPDKPPVKPGEGGKPLDGACPACVPGQKCAPCTGTLPVDDFVAKGLPKCPATAPAEDDTWRARVKSTGADPLGCASMTESPACRAAAGRGCGWLPGDAGAPGCFPVASGDCGGVDAAKCYTDASGCGLSAATGKCVPLFIEVKDAPAAGTGDQTASNATAEPLDVSGRKALERARNPTKEQSWVVQLADWTPSRLTHALVDVVDWVLESAGVPLNNRPEVPAVIVNTSQGPMELAEKEPAIPAVRPESEFLMFPCNPEGATTTLQSGDQCTVQALTTVTATCINPSGMIWPGMTEDGAAGENLVCAGAAPCPAGSTCEFHNDLPATQPRIRIDVAQTDTVSQGKLVDLLNRLLDLKIVVRVSREEAVGLGPEPDDNLMPEAPGGRRRRARPRTIDTDLGDPSVGPRTAADEPWDMTGDTTHWRWGQDRIDSSGTWDNRRDVGGPYSNRVGHHPDGSFHFQLDGAGVTVFVMDTGVTIQHDEFEGRAKSDFSGQYGYSDRDGHGTHCAGTVAGKYSGVARKASIQNVKVLGDDGTGSGTSDGVDWIIANKAKYCGGGCVASMSLGGGGSEYSDNNVRRLWQAGILAVVAAGNDAESASLHSPARVGGSCRSDAVPGVMTVGSTDHRDMRSSFSNYGSCVDIFAPGSTIYSAKVLTVNGYTQKSGTSMATPHVAGAAALFLGERCKGHDQANPCTATPEEVKEYLLCKAVKVFNDPANDDPTYTSIPSGSPNKLLQADFDGQSGSCGAGSSSGGGGTPATTPAPPSGGGGTTTGSVGCACHDGVAKSCVAWSQFSISNSPTNSVCANPDSDSGGNWCFYGTKRNADGNPTEWAYCETAPCGDSSCGGSGPSTTPAPATTPTPPSSTPEPPGDTPKPATPEPPPPSGGDNVCDAESWSYFGSVLPKSSYQISKGTSYGWEDTVKYCSDHSTCAGWAWPKNAEPKTSYSVTTYWYTYAGKDSAQFDTQSNFDYYRCMSRASGRGRRAAALSAAPLPDPGCTETVVNTAHPCLSWMDFGVDIVGSQCGNPYGTGQPWCFYGKGKDDEGRWNQWAGCAPCSTEELKAQARTALTEGCTIAPRRCTTCGDAQVGERKVRKCRAWKDFCRDPEGAFGTQARALSAADGALEGVEWCFFGDATDPETGEYIEYAPAGPCRAESVVGTLPLAAEGEPGGRTKCPTHRVCDEEGLEDDSSSIAAVVFCVLLVVGTAAGGAFVYLRKKGGGLSGAMGYPAASDELKDVDYGEGGVAQNPSITGAGEYQAAADDGMDAPMAA